jgi:hypothetical protein
VVLDIFYDCWYGVLIFGLENGMKKVKITVLILILAIPLVFILLFISRGLVSLLNVEIWLSLAIIISFWIGLVLIFGWCERNKWERINHIPRWVKRQVKLISEEFTKKPGQEPERTKYLTGRWYVYKLSFKDSSGQLLSIFRKRNTEK